MKIKNHNGKEEMANLQGDYLAKKNKTVCMKKYLPFHILYRIIYLPHGEK
jgi:hypothetical protein